MPNPNGYWLTERGMVVYGMKMFGDTELTREEYKQLLKIPLVERWATLAKMREEQSATT